MLIATWIVAALLALAFFGAGLMKIIRPRDALAASGMGWAADFSPAAVKLIGGLEVVGALGLILPLLTGIAPVLSPLAGVGLALVMIGAVVVHVRRKESPVPAVVLTVLSIASAVLGFLTLL